MRRFIYIMVAGLLAVCPLAQADLGVEHSRVVQAGDSPVSVRVWNDGVRDSLVQAWIDVGDGAARPEQLKVPYVVVPPMFKLSPGRNRDIMIRAISGQSLPQDRESVFWLNILDVPAGVRQDTAPKLEYAVNWRIKVFHRPKNLKGSVDTAASVVDWQIESSGETSRLIARNPTPFHVILARLDLDGRQLLLEPSNALIAPFSEWSLPLHGDTEGVQLNFRWVDDAGRARNGQASVSGR